MVSQRERKCTVDFQVPGTVGKRVDIILDYDAAVVSRSHMGPMFEDAGTKWILVATC